MNGAAHDSRSHAMPFGTELQQNGSTLFRFFAPACSSVRLEITGQRELIPMQSDGNGWHRLETDAAPAGTQYFFVLPDGTRVPDPASRFQPKDVDGPSEVTDPTSYQWGDREWHGRDWADAVIYEAHVGAFTPEGTFLSAIEKLDHLAGLGVTCIEIMSFTDFLGRRNWGYDGVLLYAPDSAYGRPEDLKRLIDAAHARDLMVVLDVVYNHLGLEGGPIKKYWPQFYSPVHKNSWGTPPNFDAEGNGEVREFILHNALYWLNEFHLDGLRIDASDALDDDSARHILDELSDRVRALPHSRNIHLILEDQRDMSASLQRDQDLNPQRYTAQWNHKMAHLRELVEGAHDSITPEQKTETIAKAITHGFGSALDKSGRERSCRDVLPAAQVAFLQTHDLVGNDVFGRRVYRRGTVPALRALSALYLLMPQVPMMFMGDEWAASSPFAFFCDYEGKLAQDALRGRIEFLQKLGFSQAEIEKMPNPRDEKTFQSAKLEWYESLGGVHAEWLAWYKRILAVRRSALRPLLDLPCNGSNYEIAGTYAFSAHWIFSSGARLALQANLNANSKEGFSPQEGDTIWLEGTIDTPGRLGPWTVCWKLQ